MPLRGWPCRRPRRRGPARSDRPRPATDPGGLEVTAGCKPVRDSGTFSYAAHAAVVAVDPDLGAVEILDSVIVEDGGTLVNPRVVDGQIHGGLAQGIGAALFEEMRFDARVQPLASDVGRRPPARRGRRADGAHRPHEDALAPPAALANAVDDALAPLGVELLHSSITPRRIVEAVRAAGTPAATARGAA